MNIQTKYVLGAIAIVLAAIVAIMTFSPSLFAEFKKRKEAALEPWPVSKTKFQAALRKPDCYETFSAIWPHIKAGNMEARAELAMILAPSIHGTMMVLPGNNDYFTRLRNIVTVSIHSTGVQFKDPDDTKLYEEHIRKVYYFLWPLWPPKEFVECIDAGKKQECVDIAIRENLVPRFEKFVKEIDSYWTNGYNPICLVPPL